MAIGEPSATEVREPRLITVAEFASMLNVSTRTLWRLLSAKQVPGPVRLGGCTRWRLDQVQQWIGRGCPDLSGEK